MTDFSWLAQEAKNIHQIFESVFYSLIVVLLLIGVFLEYFKFSVGGVPSFFSLLGRSFIAALMLASFPEFLTALGKVTDAVSGQIGELNEFKLVLAKMSSQLDSLSWSWTSVKQMSIVVISFLSFFVLYLSVYISEAVYFYAWTLLYIFSPICFALYVLPATEKAATGIYSSLFKVASWKIVWSVLATLLWSAALIDLEKLGESTDFLTIVLFNLMLAGSLLFTPLISNMLFAGGFAQAAAKVGGAAAGGALYGASKLMGVPSLKSPNQNLSGITANTFKSFRENSNQPQSKDSLPPKPQRLKRQSGLKGQRSRVWHRKSSQIGRSKTKRTNN